MKNILVFAALLASIAFSSASYSAVLSVDGSGQLTGATGVDVGGVLYDVEFKVGTFNDIFNNGLALDTTDASSFGFTYSLVNALNTQVFVGIYDDDYSLTKGCEVTANNACYIYTPYDALGSSRAFLNFNLGGSPDSIVYASWPVDSVPTDFAVYADWSTSAVPLPAGAWLFLSALGMLVGIRQRMLGQQ